MTLQADSVKVIGLRDATQDDIDKLFRKYPNGEHITHHKDGEKLPFNGVFRTVKRGPGKC